VRHIGLSCMVVLLLICTAGVDVGDTADPDVQTLQVLDNAAVILPEVASLEKVDFRVERTCRDAMWLPTPHSALCSLSCAGCADPPSITSLRESLDIAHLIRRHRYYESANHSLSRRRDGLVLRMNWRSAVLRTC